LQKIAHGRATEGTEMATGSMDRVIQGLRRAALIQDGFGPSDAELLTCFIERRDEVII